MGPRSAIFCPPTYEIWFEMGLNGSTGVHIKTERRYMAEDHFLVLAPKPLVALLCNVGHSEGHVGSLNNDVSFDVDEGSHVQKTNF